jgi:hypothetical protein
MLPGTLICPVDHVTIVDLVLDLLLCGLLSGTPSGIIPLSVFGRARKGGGHGNEGNRSGCGDENLFHDTLLIRY